ncbi:MAG: hypothetical protein SVT52_04840 [Planctomycetota bacterium]|nr:hypothetical protein [Planctomycetota bacterium]
MKSKRRHELKQNVLDLELAKGMTFLRQRGWQLGWAVIIAAVAVFAAIYIYRSHVAKRAALQAEYSALKAAASDPGAKADELLDRFRLLAEQDDNERIAALACVDMGDIHAGQADQAGRAADWYHAAIQRFPGQALAAAKARVGLAKLAEQRLDFDTARAEYQAVLKMPQFHNQPVAACAKQGLADLEKLHGEVPMATTLPSQPATLPAGPKLSVPPSSDD